MAAKSLVDYKEKKFKKYIFSTHGSAFNDLSQIVCN